METHTPPMIDRSGLFKNDTSADDTAPIAESTGTTELYVDESHLDDAIVEEAPVLREENTDDNQEPAEEEPEQVVSRKPHSVIQDYNINAKLKLTYADHISLPSNFNKESRMALESAPNIALADNPEAREWGRHLLYGMEFNTVEEAFVPTLEDPDAEFRHRFEHNGVSMTGAEPKYKDRGGANLKGEKAVLRLITHMGLGTLYQQPLYHSGFWITFKPAPESEMVELNRLLMADKILMGRFSYGIAFSNMTSYTVDRLVDFALAHVYDTTIKAEGVSIENLKDHILVQDIPSLLTGFMCTMYPKGFNYSRSCVANPEKCNYVIEDTLNLSKLHWVNFKALTDWQKTFMSMRRPRSQDLASVKRYREEMTKLQKRQIIINEGQDDEVKFLLSSPTTGSYVDAGHVWIGNIVDSVEKLIGVDATDLEKNDLIGKMGQASAMRQYGHWVEAIEFDGNIIDDRETIDKNLDVLSADDIVRSEFLRGVIDYINSSTMSIVGIPVFDCPACNGTQETPLKSGHFTNIIPLDPVQLFFALLTQRITRVTER